MKTILKNVIGAALWLCAAVATAQTAGMQALPGHVPKAIARRHLLALGRLSETNRLHLAIGLPLRNRAGLGALLQQIYDPASPNYRHYLTPEEFTRQFGPSVSDYAAVVAFAEANGLSVGADTPDRTFVNVSGPVADIERIFNCRLLLYRHPSGRVFYAPDVEPSVNLAVPILHVTGLDNFTVPHPAGLKKTLGPATAFAKPDAGTGPGGYFMGYDFRAAYVPGASLDGSGQAVGLFELDGYYSNDIVAYAAYAGLPNVPLTNVRVNTSGAPGSGNSEVALDIEMAISMAPGLSRVIVYEGPNPASSADVLGVLEAMSTNVLAAQLSSSWVVGDDPNYDTQFIKMGAQGQSYFQSSGDAGAYYPGLQDSEDDTNITLVGGTTLATLTPGGAYASETVWNEYGNGEGAGGSGGGTNLNGRVIPAWQTGINMTTNLGSTQLRNVPDVAMNADNFFVVADNGQQEFIVGTSGAAPLWAGFTALVNQQAAAYGKGSVGFLNPAIYAIGKSPFYPYDFNDIITGNNTNTTVTDRYYAVPGYDLCTGWGTPAGLNLIIALATPDALGVLPGTGFTAYGPVGGPFNINAETLMLTNSSASSLTWSAGAPAWLTVSPASGTLPAKTSTMVSVSLNATVNGLLPAIYTSSVAFTNLVTGLPQKPAFTLQLDQSLVLNGGFETGDFSFWTFIGDYIDSSSNFLNGVVNAGTFSNGSGTNWIHSGTYGAAFGEPSVPAYISQTLPTAPGGNYQLSFWLNNLGGYTPNRFLINWNTHSPATNTIYNQSDMPAINSWTNLVFYVTAAGTNTVLQFGLQNDNYYLGLDDITVLPVPTPTFRTVTLTNNMINLAWNSLTGLVYQVQYATNLNPAVWNNLGNPLTAADYTLSATNSVGPDPSRFYRVRWLH